MPDGVRAQAEVRRDETIAGVEGREHPCKAVLLGVRGRLGHLRNHRRSTRSAIPVRLIAQTSTTAACPSAARSVTWASKRAGPWRVEPSQASADGPACGFQPAPAPVHSLEAVGEVEYERGAMRALEGAEGLLLAAGR